MPSNDNSCTATENQTQDRETKEVYDISEAQRQRMAAAWTAVGIVLTAVLAGIASFLPFPESWGIPGFVVFLGIGGTLMMALGAMFAPPKEVDSDE